MKINVGGARQSFLFDFPVVFIPSITGIPFTACMKYIFKVV